MLLSDGHANTGDSSPEGLRARGKRATQNELVVSTIGIGEGFNEYLMTQIADAGTGNYHYLAESSALALDPRARAVEHARDGGHRAARPHREPAPACR